MPPLVVSPWCVRRDSGVSPPFFREYLDLPQCYPGVTPDSHEVKVQLVQDRVIIYLGLV